jgi:hypothetical protein
MAAKPLGVGKGRSAFLATPQSHAHVVVPWSNSKGESLFLRHDDATITPAEVYPDLG